MRQPNQTGITKDSGEKSVSVALVAKELHVTCHKKTGATANRLCAKN